MDGISTVAATRVALTQARGRAEIAARLVDLAQRAGPSQRALELVRGVAQTTAELLARDRPPGDRLDLYV